MENFSAKLYLKSVVGFFFDFKIIIFSDMPATAAMFEKRISLLAQIYRDVKSDLQLAPDWHQDQFLYIVATRPKCAKTDL